MLTCILSLRKLLCLTHRKMYPDEMKSIFCNLNLAFMKMKLFIIYVPNSKFFPQYNFKKVINKKIIIQAYWVRKIHFNLIPLSYRSIIVLQYRHFLK